MTKNGKGTVILSVVVVVLVLMAIWPWVISVETGKAEGLAGVWLPTPWPTLCPDKWCGEGVPTRTPMAEGLASESPLPTPWPTLCPDKWCGEGIPTPTPMAAIQAPENQGRGKALGHYKPKRK